MKYLLENCYFELGSNIFRQVIGIPMGSDPAPFFANLFLFYCDSKWIKKVNESGIRQARRFATVLRLIDNFTRGGCRGLPLLPVQRPEMAHINFQSSVFVSKKTVNKILKLDQK